MNGQHVSDRYKAASSAFNLMRKLIVKVFEHSHFVTKTTKKQHFGYFFLRTKGWEMLKGDRRRDVKKVYNNMCHLHRHSSKVPAAVLIDYMQHVMCCEQRSVQMLLPARK